MKLGGTLSALIACATVPAPSAPLALRLRALDGSTLNLASLRGQVVLLHVMNTWAEPALIELPRLRLSHQRHAREGLAIVAVVLDPEPAAARIFAETFELPYTVVTPVEAAFASPAGPFGAIRTVPTSLLIDREGRLIARAEGTWDPEILEAALRRALER